MLSKATNICLVSLRATPKLPLTKLIFPRIPILSHTLPFSTLYKLPHYNFASGKEDPKKTKQPVKTSPKELEEETESEAFEDESAEGFVDFMQNEATTSEINYKYNDKTIFEVSSVKEDFTKRYLFYWGMAATWSTVSYLTFSFINPYVAIVPVWFLAGSLMTIRMSSQFSKQMIKKIELVDNNHIKIYPLNKKGKGVLCSIEGTEILGIKVMTGHPKDKNEAKVKSYLILANFSEAGKKNKKYNKMRLIVDPKLTSVANIDLLKSILYGHTNEVTKFEFEQRTEESKNWKQEVKGRDVVDDAEGQAKFEFKEEEFEELRRQLRENKTEEQREQEKKNEQ